MNCEQCEEHILDYQENRLTTSERAAVDRHLANCSHCRNFAQQLQQIDAVLVRALKAPVLSPDFQTHLRQRIQSEAAVIPEAERAERKRRIQAEYEATLAQMRHFAVPRQVLESLGFAVVIGLVGWRAWLALPQLTRLFAGLGWSEANQSLLLYSGAAVIFLAMGLAAMLPQQLRSTLRAV